MNLTTYQMQLLAKKCICDYCKRELNIEYAIEDIDFVMFGYVLGNMKGTFIDHDKDSHRYYEVTWNNEKQEMYLDVYVKTCNVLINLTDDENTETESVEEDKQE